MVGPIDCPRLYLLQINSWLVHDPTSQQYHAYCGVYRWAAVATLFCMTLAYQQYIMTSSSADLTVTSRRVSVSLQTKRARYQLWVELYGFCPRTKNSGQLTATGYITDTPTAGIDGQRLSGSDDRRAGWNLLSQSHVLHNLCRPYLCCLSVNFYRKIQLFMVRSRDPEPRDEHRS